MSTWAVPSYAEGWTVPGYTEQREIGRGASGRVVQAVHDASGHPVAIRYLSPALARDPAFTRKFRAQAQVLGELRVPQVVRVFDYAEQPGESAAVVTELVNGVSLRELIDHGGPVGPEAALAVLKDSLLGLAAVHRLGIVHQEHKPGNVLVDTAGTSKLADVGVAVRAGDQTSVAGTAHYTAPERRNGAPASPVTDIYAATAVFSECLTGETPFTGEPGQPRQQDEGAAVPLDLAVPPLRRLITQGMAQNPSRRPHSAIAFVAELEALAGSACGPGWEERGRRKLAERVSALLPSLLRGGRARSSRRPAAATAPGGGGGRRRRVLAVVSVAAAAVVVIGGVAAAVTLQGKNRDPVALADSSSSSSQVTSATPSLSAVAGVTPPVAASRCTAPTAFTYSGTLSATAPGSVEYQWVYSSGKPGPVETVSFTAAGQRLVTGETVHAETAGGGWAEIKVISPVAQTSNRAAYKLLCGGGSAGGITPAATVQPASRTASCVPAPPAFTATGSIKAGKAETVTYYWARSDGRDSPPATLTFTGPGTKAVPPLTVTPLGTSGSGEAILVVTSPVAVSSAPATYTLTCKAPATRPATQPAPATSPAGKPATAGGISAAASVSPAHEVLRACLTPVSFTFTGTITDNKAGVVSYHWKLPGGNGPAETLNFARAGTQAVTAGTYVPQDNAAAGNESGTGTIVVTSPVSVSSNAAAFTVTCPQATPSSGLEVAQTRNAATATAGQAYSEAVTVTGGKAPYTWGSVTGLPPGLTATGNNTALTIAGTPTTPGTFNASVTVKDSSSPALTRTAYISIDVSPRPVSISTVSLPAGTAGSLYDTTLTATFHMSGNFTWNASGLPAGLTISTAGRIAGTPAKPGTYSVIAGVSDHAVPAPHTAFKTFSLVINPAAA